MGFNVTSYGRRVVRRTSPSGVGGGTPIPDAGDIVYDNGGSGLTADDLQDAIDELVTLIGSGAYLTDTDGGGGVIHHHGAMGAAETFDLALGNYHTGTLDDDCTFTFAAVGSGRERFFVMRLLQDGSGGHVVTWPGSVSWIGGSAPTLDTTAGVTEVLTFHTLDGGTVWLGAHAGGGGGGASALDDLTDVVITSATDADRLRYNGSNWVNSNLHWEPMVDYDGLVMLDSAGGIHVHEVSH